MHRDIKLENILLSRKQKMEEEIYDIKVIDWGCSSYYSQGVKLCKIYINEIS